MMLARLYKPNFINKLLKSHNRIQKRNIAMVDYMYDHPVITCAIVSSIACNSLHITIVPIVTTMMVCDTITPQCVKLDRYAKYYIAVVIIIIYYTIIILSETLISLNV